MALLDKFKPERPVMKAAMMGPRAVGKTTILTAVFNETKTSITTTMLKLSERGDTGKLLQDRLYYLKSVFKKQEEIVDNGTPPAGLEATGAEGEFLFSFGIQGKEPSVDLEIKDFPGEYVIDNPERVKTFIEESTAIFIAIDTPHLMEKGGQYNEVKNKTSLITRFFKEVLENIQSEKLVLLIPLKCEKYFLEKRMEEVLQRVEEKYGELIQEFRRSMKVCCAVTPILTLGNVEFDDFQYDANGNVVLGDDNCPDSVRYKYVGEKPVYAPRFCSQPLYSMLSFIAAQYTRQKKRKSFLEGFLDRIWNLFNSDSTLFEEILKMEKNRISDAESLGYKVLCGGELFHYDH